MRSINGAVLRSAFAMVLGFVLVLWPEAAITYLVITIGILFILPGLFAILSYFTRPKNENGEKPDVSYRGSGKHTVRSVVGDHARVLREYINVLTRSLIGNCRCTAIGFIDIRKEMEQCTVGVLPDAGFDLDNRSNDSCLPVRGGGKYIRNLRCSQHFLRGL